MKQAIFKIRENTKIAKNVFKMTLAGESHDTERSGQFINIKIDGLFLRRPISVCDYSDNEIVIIYKVVGHGTEKMSLMKEGEELDVLTGLGNGYDTSKSGDTPLLIGGGAGVPPLYNLCKRLVGEGKTPSVILGFNTADEVFFEHEFALPGVKVIVATADGSRGVKGFVTDAMRGLSYSYIYACGPEPMLMAVDKTAESSGQFSFEERMGCGFGACMGCSCKTLYGTKRICKDGPVLEREEIIWPTQK